jgi:hypothetical protein
MLPSPRSSAASGASGCTGNRRSHEQEPPSAHSPRITPSLARTFASDARGHVGAGRDSTADCGETRFRGILCVMADPLIEREETVALLFNVSDIASALERIERLLEEDDGEEEADEG